MQKYKAVIIGGSAGSFQVITKILSSLPKNFPLPVILCLHRLKHVKSGFVEALSIKSSLPIYEPNDKDHIKPGNIYLAPANYHLFIELGNRFALSTEDQVNHSRPSIDLTFFTAASVYREKAIGIILSGANKDGAHGLKKMGEKGATTIVQNPEECQVATMTKAAMEISKIDHVFSTNEIINFLKGL
ncbi:MAG: chemotaxis protein CheB [Bacteroidales bacterium]|nr:chemotaxis protein CheB [Bacteroidales bacterium]